MDGAPQACKCLNWVTVECTLQERQEAEIVLTPPPKKKMSKVLLCFCVVHPVGSPGAVHAAFGLGVGGILCFQPFK